MAYTNKTTMPSCNRLLQRKWDSKKFQSHQDRLRSIRSTIDSSSPKEYLHIRQNLRKAQIENDRQASIEIHNHKLLEKMDQIMSTTGRVDHRNMDWKPKRSLSFVKKQHENERLMRENFAMLKRIQYAKPMYSTTAWESEYHKHKSLIKNISTLPPVKKGPPHRRVRTLPAPSALNYEHVTLPPITSTDKGNITRPVTDQSEIHEELVDVDGLPSVSD